MFREPLVQTPRQVLQSVARGLVSFAFFFGNPAARMVQITHQGQQQRLAVPGTGPVELLRQLGVLRAAGLLTAEEFTEKKTRLLAQI